MFLVLAKEGQMLGLVKADKGLNYLAEQRCFDGGIWYLLPSFGTTTESSVRLCVKEGSERRQVNFLGCAFQFFSALSIYSN